MGVGGWGGGWWEGSCSGPHPPHNGPPTVAIVENRYTSYPSIIHTTHLNNVSCTALPPTTQALKQKVAGGMPWQVCLQNSWRYGKNVVSHASSNASSPWPWLEYFTGCHARLSFSHSLLSCVSFTDVHRIESWFTCCPTLYELFLLYLSSSRNAMSHSFSVRIGYMLNWGPPGIRKNRIWSSC